VLVQGDPTFSPIYQFASTPQLGITAAHHFNISSVGVEGVWGADMLLDDLERLVIAAGQRSASSGVVFIAGMVLALPSLSPCGRRACAPSLRRLLCTHTHTCTHMHTEGVPESFNLVATSQGPVISFSASEEQLLRVKAPNSSESFVADISAHMLSQGLSVSEPVLFQAGTGLRRLAVTAAPLDLPLLGTNLTVVVGIEMESFQGVRRAWSSVSLVFCVPVIFVTVMLSVALRTQTVDTAPMCVTPPLFCSSLVFGGLPLLSLITVASPRRCVLCCSRGVGERATLMHAPIPLDEASNQEHLAVHQPKEAGTRKLLRLKAQSGHALAVARRVPGLRVGPKPSFGGAAPQTDRDDAPSSDSNGDTSRRRGLGVNRRLHSIKHQHLFDYRAVGCVDELGVEVAGKALGTSYHRLLAFVDDTCIHNVFQGTDSTTDLVSDLAARLDEGHRGDRIFVRSLILLSGVQVPDPNLMNVVQRYVRRRLGAQSAAVMACAACGSRCVCLLSHPTC